MADALVQRVLAPHLAAVHARTELPLTVDLVVPDTVLFGDDDAGGFVEGYGEVPGHCYLSVAPPVSSPRPGPSGARVDIAHWPVELRAA